MHRWAALALSLGYLGCTSSSSSDDTTPVRDSICVYSSAKCFPDICAKCTVGADGACPPADTAFVEICSEELEKNCRDRVVAPEKVSPSSTQLRYTRDVRIVHGITTCAKFRESGETTATSIERLCEGNCQ